MMSGCDESASIGTSAIASAHHIAAYSNPRCRINNTSVDSSRTTTQHTTAQHNTTLHTTARHNTTLHGTPRHPTFLFPHQPCEAQAAVHADALVLPGGHGLAGTGEEPPRGAAGHQAWWGGWVGGWVGVMEVWWVEVRG